MLFPILSISECDGQHLSHVRWWEVRRARNSKAATYRCPLCGYYLHATTEHTLISPEGDSSRRRHAHTECVLAARKNGTFKTYDDWRATQPRRSLLQRLRRG